MKRIVTHKKPDADALVATWLAERYLFDGEAVQILFVSRSADFSGHIADCVVDVSNRHDPQCLIFDHKPPAFDDRNQSCATELLWRHLLSMGRAVGHLAALVEVVHEGDGNPPRRASVALAQSRIDGLHAQVAATRLRLATDQQLYEAVRDWLDDYDAAQKNLAHRGAECRFD